MFIEKYAPKIPEQFIGTSQQETVGYLLNHKPTKIILQGPSGIGKTSIVHWYSELLNGSLTDFDSSKLGVTELREIIFSWQISSLENKTRIYFFDEIQALTSPQQKEFLKILEPKNFPDDIIFIAATTDINKIRTDLKSRLKVFRLKSPNKKEFMRLGNAILKRENAIYLADYLDRIYNISNGNIRSFVENIEMLVGGISFNDIRESTYNSNSLAYKVLFNKPNLKDWWTTELEEPPNKLVYIITKTAKTRYIETGDEKFLIIHSAFAQGFNQNTSEELQLDQMLLDLYKKLK